MEELKLVSAKEHKFAYQRNYYEENFLNFRTVKTLMQGIQIPIKKFATTRKFSIPTMVEEIKLVVLRTYEFEYREKSLSRALLA